MTDTDTLSNDGDVGDDDGLINRLDDIVTIGSTVPANGEQNRYGSLLQDVCTR
jgi:hypothetical protein